MATQWDNLEAQGKEFIPVPSAPVPAEPVAIAASAKREKQKPASKTVVFSKATESALKAKVQEHNAKAPEGRKATIGMLKAVYRRGAAAFTTKHSGSSNREMWAMGRVNAFLKLLKTGKPANSAYKSDNDLLPAEHPKSSKHKKSLTADASINDYENELIVSIGDREDYNFPEDAIIAMAEYSGYGYEAESAIRASWLRGVRNGDDPFLRAALLASLGPDSLDGDLLPVIEEDGE